MTGAWLRRVARLYDSKRRDFNWRLAPDGVIHHHNGLVRDRRGFMRGIAAGGEAADLAVHQAETALSREGFRALGRLPAGAALLDAGCGRGGSALLLASAHSSLSVTGVTISAYQASAARAAAGRLGLSGRVKFRRASMLSLPFRGESFSHIWACESTEHAPDLSGFFREAFRVARRRARLVVIAWVRNPSHPSGEKYARLADRAYVTRIHPDNEYREAAARAGWTPHGGKDLTRATALYWEGRSRLKEGSGTEKFMTPAFASGAILYRLYSFDRAVKAPR